MTMSDSGPVPRSHSPLVCVRLSRSIRGFLCPEKVSKMSGFLVSFGFHGRSQPFAKVHQFGEVRRVARRTAGPLADVPLGPVDALQQRFDSSAENVVIVWAAEAALGAKLHVL